MNIEAEDKQHWALPIAVAAGIALCNGLINWLFEELKEKRKKNKPNNSEPKDGTI